MKRSFVDLEIEVDRSRCVICGGPNDCALARRAGNREADAGEPCWCVAETFPADLLDRANARDGGESCVCRRCLERSRSRGENG